MKTFEIRVTQLLTGYYEGTLEIQAKNKKEALKIIENMDTKDIDESVENWQHGNEYDGDHTTIEVYQDTLKEI